MHLNRWKSVLVSWANALEVAPTMLNFIGDLSPQFFISLCSYLKNRDVSALQESVTYIKDYYKSLILGSEEDDNYVALLATAYLIFTSLHQTNDELCKRLCRVSNTEQAQIKSALEAFVDIQPAKITKELIFMTLALLPEGSELCENSPYLTSPGSSSSNNKTLVKDDETPRCPRSRRSSRFKKVKHQLHMTMTLKNTLQDELESARETISNLESVVVVKNQDIAQLKERCRRLLKEHEADKSVTSPCPQTPVNDGRGCIKCKLFERQIYAYEEGALQDKSEIQGLNEFLVTLTKKISMLESEKRTLDGQLELYEEQILKNNDEISALQNLQQDLIINKKELESIIEELRDARSAADCSIEADIPNNLGSEVIDLQLREMRLVLDERDQIICERDNDISNLREKLTEMQCEKQSAIQELKRENELCNAKIISLQKDVERLSGECKLVTTRLADAQKMNEDLEQQLQESHKHVTTLYEDLGKQEGELQKYYLLCNEQERVLAMKNEEVSSLENKVLHHTVLMQKKYEENQTLTHEMETPKSRFEERCSDLERELALKEKKISTLQKKAEENIESLKKQMEAFTGLKEECNTLQSSMTEKSADISLLKDEISLNQSAILGMEQENDLCKAKILSLQNDLKRSSGDYKLATTKLVESQKMKECLEQQVQDCQLCITSLTEDLEKQGEKLQKLVRLYNQQEKVLAIKKEELFSLENEVVHITAVALQEKELKEALVQEMKTQKSGFEERCNELEREVALKEVSISTLEKKAEESIVSFQQQVEAFTVLNEECKKLQSCLTEKAAEISLLKNEISQNQSAIAGMQQENELLNAKILTSYNEIERLKSEYELATEQLAGVRKNEEDLEHKLKERQQLITSFSEDLERQEKEWQELEMVYNEQEKVLAMRNDQISSLEKEVAHITAVVQQEKEAKEALVQEMETQKSSFKELCNKLERDVALREENISSLENYAKQNAESLRQEVEACTGLKEECKTLQSSRTEKNADISVLKLEISQNQTMILELQQENDLCKAKILGLQNDLERSLGNYKLATSKLIESQKMKECFEQQVQESQQCITSLTEDLQKQGEELRKLVRSYNQQEKVLAIKKEELSSLENEVAHITAVLLQEKELKEALVQEMKTQKSAFEERCNELEREVALKEVSISTLEKKAKEGIESLQQQVEAFTVLNEECKTLQSCLTGKTAEISQNQSTIVGMQKENELLNAKILTSHNEIERLKSEYELATEQLAVRENEEDLEHKLKERQQLITSFSEDLERQGKEWQELEMLYNEQEKVLAMRNDQISSLEKEVVHITAVVQQEREAKEALVQEMETQKSSFKELCNKLERDVALREENISSLENYAKQNAESLRQEVEACTGLKEECKTLQSTLTEKNADISVLKLEISLNQTVILELQQENDLCKAQIRTLGDNIEKLTGDLEHATSQLFEVRKEKEGIEQLLQESHQRFSTVCEKQDRQKEKLLSIDALYKEQENELTVKVDQLSSLKNEFVRYESIKREIEHENLKLKERNDALEAEVLKLALSNDVTDAELLKILEQKNILEERLTTLEKQLEKKVCNEEKLQQNVIALQTALDTQKALTSTIEEGKRCLESLQLEIELEKSNTQPAIRSLQAEVEKLTNENKSAASLASSLKCETESLNRRLENFSMELDIKNETILMMEATLRSLNSKVGLLEATIKDKDSLITVAKMDLHNTEVAFDKYREESQRHHDSRREELVDLLEQKEGKLDDLEERIANMAEELVHVSQTFNVEKTSLIDHAKNLEEMLEKSTAAEEHLQDKVRLISNQLADAERKVSHLDEKLSLSVELHSCEKRELTTKNQFFKTQMDEYKLKCERLTKEIEDNNLEGIKEKSCRLETENQDLKNKLELKTRDIEWYTHEMGLLNSINDKNMKIINQLDEENKNLIRSKKEVVDRLEKEIALLKEENKRLDPHATDISVMLRQEYEEKLQKLKGKMRKVYTEKVEAMMKFKTGEEKMYADEELKRAKQKRNSLEAKVRELSDEILILREEKRALISNHVFRTPAYLHGGPISNPAYESPPMLKTHSLDRLPITSHGLDNLGADLSLDHSFSSRRTSTSSNLSNHLPKGIGKVFPAAEEEGEVFDNRCLSDLKEGICTLPSGSGGVDRMSILQQRNSMCPPHLKSSYPVESQFFAPNAKEDEIKVITKGNKENVPEGSRSGAGTPSKLRSLFSGRR